MLDGRHAYVRIEGRRNKRSLILTRPIGFCDMKAWLAVLPITIAMPTAAWAQKTTETARDAELAELVCQLAGLCGDMAQAEADREKSRRVLFPERDVPPPTGLAAYRDCVFRMVGFFASAERQPSAREKVRKALIQCEHLKIAMHVQDFKDTESRALNFRRQAGINTDFDPAVTELEVRQRIYVAERLVLHEMLEKYGKLSPYEFKGISLNLPLEEFWKLKHPDGVDDATVACRGNAITAPAGTPEVPDVKLLSLSIVMNLGAKMAPARCAWFGNGELLPLRVTRMEDPSWRYSFYFHPIDGVNDLRLSEIVLRGRSTSVPELAAEFESKYGEPWRNARVVYDADDGWTTRRAWVWIGPELDGSAGNRKIRSQIELTDNNPSNGNFQMRMLLYETSLEGETWRVPGA